MDALRRFFLSIFSICLGVACTIITMIFGWGLEPKSWGVIIGIGVFGHIFALTTSFIAVSKDYPPKEN